MMIYTNLLFTFFSSGIEDNPTVFYKIIRGSTDQTNKYDTFYLQQRKEGDYTYADVKVNHPLDYERIKEYNLTVRVEVCITQRARNFKKVQAKKLVKSNESKKILS